MFVEISSLEWSINLPNIVIRFDAFVPHKDVILKLRRTLDMGGEQFKNRKRPKVLSGFFFSFFLKAEFSFFHYLHWYHKIPNEKLMNIEKANILFGYLWFFSFFISRNVYEFQVIPYWLRQKLSFTKTKSKNQRSACLLSWLKSFKDKNIEKVYNYVSEILYLLCKNE